MFPSHPPPYKIDLLLVFSSFYATPKNLNCASSPLLTSSGDASLAVCNIHTREPATKRWRDETRQTCEKSMSRQNWRGWRRRLWRTEMNFGEARDERL